MSFKTPILFIVFNRPQQTKIVFEVLKKLQPSKLYVAADGPRLNNTSDIEKSREVREIFESVDWPCELKTMFRDENLGCGKGPAESISWLFSEEEYGIILEDDCVPDLSFFKFCEELLIKYRYDSRVMHIAGTNHNPSYVRDSDYSYFFSQVGHMWGWATWRRAWDLFDIKMKAYDEINKKEFFKDAYPNYFIRKYMMLKFSETYNEKIVGVWDYQWEFCRLINSGMTIMCTKNLVKNIGFGADATHTFSENNYFKDTDINSISFPLKHPPFLIRDKKSETKHYYKMFTFIIKRKFLSALGIKGYDFKG